MGISYAELSERTLRSNNYRVKRVMNLVNNDDLSTMFDDIETSFSQSFSITFSAIIEDINEHLNVVLASVKSRAKQFQEATLRELETLRANKENDRMLIELNNQRDLAELNAEEQFMDDYEQVMLQEQNMGREERKKEKKKKSARYEPPQVVQNNIPPRAKPETSKVPKQEKVTADDINSSSSANVTEETKSPENESEELG